MARKIKYIVLHCTAGPQNQTVEQILSFWKNVRKWKTPGYHFIITPDGNYENLQPLEKMSNGVAGNNSNSIHISYIGGVVTDDSDPINAKGTPVDNRTWEQKDTMKKLVIEMNELYPSAIILGHRDFSPDKNRNGIIEPSEWIKACPSFSVKEWLSEIGFSTTFVKNIKITTAVVNIRTGPGVKFDKVTSALKKGERVLVVADNSEWSYVTYNSHKGWISSEYLH